MAAKSKAEYLQADLLAKIPPGTKRVWVKTAAGGCCYKNLELLGPTDEIQVNKRGLPIIMRGHPGRPKGVTLDPANAIVAETIKKKNVAIQNDPLLKAAREHPESPEVLQQILLALGEEQASIAFERAEAERNGVGTSDFSVKRVAALKAAANAWLTRKEQVANNDVDLKSPGFGAVFRLIMETMRESMSSCGVTSDMIETVMAKASKMFDEDWESEAKGRMKRVL